MISKLISCFFFLSFLVGHNVYAQVCDDLIVNGCENSLQAGWSKIYACGNGDISIQYCHPRFYVGSGHNLTVVGSRSGKIVFDELLDKTTLASGIKVRKAIGKNESGKSFTGIFTYDKDDHISSCYIKSGADRSRNIVIPE